MTMLVLVLQFLSFSVLGKSNQSTLIFDTAKSQFLSNLIIDITNWKVLTDEEVFYDVFNKLFIISFTKGRMVEVTDYILIILWIGRSNH